MAPTLRKTMGLALAGFLMMAPVSMAAGSSGTTGSTSSPGAGSSPGPGTTTRPGTQMQQPGVGTQGTMGQQQGNNRFHATVEDIDQDDRTVELKLEGSSDKVEFKVPNKEILSGLKKGDRVQVSIDKTMSQSR